MAAFAEGEAASEGATEGESFDINDYTKTAERAEEAVEELRALVSDVDRLLDSGVVGSQLRQVVWYTALLILIFFVSLLAYRIASSRLVKRPTINSTGSRRNRVYAEKREESLTSDH